MKKSRPKLRIWPKYMLSNAFFTSPWSIYYHNYGNVFNSSRSPSSHSLVSVKRTSSVCRHRERTYRQSISRPDCLNLFHLYAIQWHLHIVYRLIMSVMNLVSHLIHLTTKLINFFLVHLFSLTVIEISIRC